MIIVGKRNLIGSTYTAAYPPSQNDTYVKATDQWSINYYPYYATDPTKSLTGACYDNSWGGKGNLPMRFHIDLGSMKVVSRIYYENYHSSGGNLEYGAKNFTFWGSNNATAFSTLTYGTDTNWTQISLPVSVFDQHVAADQADPKYIRIQPPPQAFRYYAFKISECYGTLAGGYNIFLRRIVLQTL